MQVYLADSPPTSRCYFADNNSQQQQLGDPLLPCFPLMFPNQPSMTPCSGGLTAVWGSRASGHLSNPPPKTVAKKGTNTATSYPPPPPFKVRSSPTGPLEWGGGGGENEDAKFMTVRNTRTGSDSPPNPGLAVGLHTDRQTVQTAGAKNQVKGLTRSAPALRCSRRCGKSGSDTTILQLTETS